MHSGLRPLLLFAVVLAALLWWRIGMAPQGAAPAGHGVSDRAASLARAARSQASAGDAIASARDRIDAVNSPAALERARQLSQATFMSGNDADSLPVSKLVERLPAQLARFKLAEGGGERSEQGGFAIATARGRYVDGGETLALTISDLAGPKGVAAYAGWSLLDAQDNTTEQGYERTQTDGGRPYYESWEAATGQAEAAVVLADRLLVSVSGTTADPATVQAALGNVDMGALERLVRP